MFSRGSKASLANKVKVQGLSQVGEGRISLDVYTWELCKFNLEFMWMFHHDISHLKGASCLCAFHFAQTPFLFMSRVLRGWVAKGECNMCVNNRLRQIVITCHDTNVIQAEIQHAKMSYLFALPRFIKFGGLS